MSSYVTPPRGCKKGPAAMSGGSRSESQSFDLYLTPPRVSQKRRRRPRPVLSSSTTDAGECGPDLTEPGQGDARNEGGCSAEHDTCTVVTLSSGPASRSEGSPSPIPFPALDDFLEDVLGSCLQDDDGPGASVVAQPACERRPTGRCLRPELSVLSRSTTDAGECEADLGEPGQGSDGKEGGGSADVNMLADTCTVEIPSIGSAETLSSGAASVSGGSPSDTPFPALDQFLDDVLASGLNDDDDDEVATARPTKTTRLS